MSSPPRASPAGLRAVVIAAASAEAVLWLLLLVSAFAADEPATRGLARDIALLGSAVFAVSGAPALVLALRGRWLRLAGLLTLIPVAAFVALIEAFNLAD